MKDIPKKQISLFLLAKQTPTIIWEPTVKVKPSFKIPGKPTMKKHSIVYINFFFILFFWGCASSPDIVTTEKGENEKYSNADIREIAVDQPYLLSGDFFRERNQPTSIDFGAIFKAEEKIASNQTKLEQKITSLQQEISSLKKKGPEKINVSPEQTVSQIHEDVDNKQKITYKTKVKIGLLIDGSKIQPVNIRKISLTAEKLVKTMPVILVSNDEIYETLAQNNVLENKDLYRTSGILTVYPGIRMLVLMEEFKTPDFFPGTASAIISIIDSGLFYRYQPIRLEMKIENNKDMNIFLENIIHSALTKAVETSKIAPWFCRSFSSEDTLFYINAGKETGLKKGMVLTIKTKGKFIKSPSGIPAGWLPGETKGLLKVEYFFGKDFAACMSISGENPTVHDFITLLEN